MKKNVLGQLIMLSQRLLIAFILQLFFCTFLLAGNSSAQRKSIEKVRVSISSVDKPVGAVLKELERKTDFKFSYNSAVTDLAQPVTITAKNQSLYQVLAEISLVTGISFTQINDNIHLGLRESQKELVQILSNAIRVKGKVMDGAGLSIPGVSILIEGTAKGTVTDIEGKFELDVEIGQSLIFSFVGYTTQTLVIEDQTDLSVVLVEDARALDEVVVVGYGTQSKQYVTGSVSKVDMKATQDLPNTNITQSLRGRVAGVQFTDEGRPGQGGQILIRGQRSISANNFPLIILDGIFFNGNLADINPNDVESMEVLKDASAGAIYGARAANGVILITTKKGTSETPTFRFNSFAGISDWSNRVKLLSPERYLQARLDFRAQTGQEANPENVADYLQPTERENYLAGNTIDPWEEIDQKGTIQSYDLSVSGRSNNTNYFISGIYTNEKGLLYNDNADRIAARINLETKVANWLNVGINTQFSKRDLSGIEPNRGFAYWLSPYASMYYDEERKDPVYLPQDDGLVINPMFNAIFNRNEEIAYNLFTNIYAIVEIPSVQGLTYRLNFSPNYRWDHNYMTTPLYQKDGQNMLGSASKFERNVIDYVVENIVNYEKTINNHGFDFTLMYGSNKSTIQSTTASSSNFFNDQLGWNALQIGLLPSTSSTASEQTGVSSMFRFNYRFKNKYLLTLTGRRDGSSQFGENNKYATFPSMAVGWVVSEEDFIKSIEAINFLKLRVSYGKVGNQAIQPYDAQGRMGTSQYVFGDGSTPYIGIHPSTMGYPDLKWETTTAANFALDFDLFKNRVGGAIEYYDMTTSDLLFRRSLPPMTGFPSVFMNVGETRNKGVELTLNTINVRSNKFEWSSNLVFSSNKNILVETPTGKDEISNLWFVGSPINVEFDYVLDGVYQEDDDIPTGFQKGFYRLKDLNGDGQLTPDDRQVIGQRDPMYRWGLTNTFSYNNFRFSVFINSMQGFISRLNALSPTNPNNFPGRANFLDADWWTEENRSNTRPSLNYTNPRGHNFYLSRDFVRVQDISLAYEVPQSWLTRYRISNLRLYVSGKNLITFTDWEGFDPENAPRDGIGFPTARSVVAGINLSF